MKIVKNTVRLIKLTVHLFGAEGMTLERMSKVVKKIANESSRVESDTSKPSRFVIRTRKRRDEDRISLRRI